MNARTLLDHVMVVLL